MASAFETFDELASALRGRASSRAEETVGASFDRRIADALDLVEHGEAPLGFDTLVSNIYEFDLPISENEFARFQQVALAWGVADDAWAYLREVVR